MKDFITPALIFSPGLSGAGYVDLIGIAGFNIRRLVSIINQTTGTVIYSTADPALRYTNVVGTTVYLFFDTSGMSAGNVIQVVYDTPYPLEVAATSLPLPTGASTSNNQLNEIAILNQIDAKVPVLVGGRVPVDGSGVTQPISAAALPLPTGAATEARQADGNASLTSIDSKTPPLVGGAVPVAISTSVPVTGPLTDAQLRATPVPVSVPGTVPVTGPLTDAQLRAIPVPVSGTVAANTGLSQPLTDSQLRASPVDVNVASTVLPTGAATSALQGVGNTLLTSIDGKFGSLGQKTMAGSAPVVIASDQSPVSIDWADAALTSFSQSGVIPVNTVLMTLDLLAYAGVAIQCNSIGTSGVVTSEWSIDNVTFVTATLNTPAGATATTFNNVGVFNLPRQARYLRLRLSTATTGGTTTINAERYVSQPTYWLATQPVSGTVTANIGSGSIAAGTNAIGDVGIQYRANATGAANRYHFVAAATTNAVNVKNTAGRLLGATFLNTTAAPVYVKLTNTTTAPTPGVTAIHMAIGIPANSSVSLDYDGGISFATGISFFTVTGAADANSTAVGLESIVGFLVFA